MNRTPAVESSPANDPPPPVRDIRYTLYLSAEELATLRERAARTTTPGVSTYVRETALGRTPAAAIPTINHDTYRELVRLGTNLNQIAHHLNAGNVVTLELGRRLSGELAHVAELVRRLRLDLTTAR